MKCSKPSVVNLVILVVLLLAMSITPALAAGTVPTTGRLMSMVHTASAGSLPQGAFIRGQYVRLATPDCPAPARMLVDGQVTYVCPPPLKLPPLPRPRLRP